MPSDEFLNIPIFHTTYAYIAASSTWYRQCPKIHRHGIVHYCYILGLDFFKTLLRANAEMGYKKLAHLREASLLLDQLKIFLRLAKDAEALTPKHYIQLQVMLQDIGKQLGGWIKSLQTKGPAQSGSVREI